MNNDEVRTSTVTQVNAIKTWQGQHGTVFFHDIQLENGDRGEIGKKMENGVRVGDQLTYTVTAGQFGNKIKEYREQYVSPNGTPAPGNGTSAAPAWRPAAPEDRNRSFALSYAKDVAVAYSGQIPADKIADATIRMAERFLSWLSNSPAEGQGSTEAF